jgi:hypothetical protein
MSDEPAHRWMHQEPFLWHPWQGKTDRIDINSGCHVWRHNGEWRGVREEEWDFGSQEFINDGPQAFRIIGPEQASEGYL